MKIYNREDFMKLPPGTLYYKFSEPWAFEDGLNVKLDTLYMEDGTPYEWFYGNVDIDAEDSGQWMGILDHMLETKSSFRSVFESCRDGCFDKKNVFLVFEKDDLLLLKKIINKCIKVSEGEEWKDEDL